MNTSRQLVYCVNPNLKPENTLSARAQAALEKVRQSGLTELQEVLPPNIDVMLLTSGDLLQLLLNCRPLMASVSCPTTRYAIESVTRRLCYRLHNERFTKLNGLSRRAKVPLNAIQETGAPI